MWAQAPPDIDIVNRLPGPSWLSAWLPVLSAIAVFVAGTIVQFIAQRREFNNRAEQWADRRDAEREAWTEARDAERERQLLTERHRAYAWFIGALDNALAVGLRTAESVSVAAPPEPSLQHLKELLDRLGTGGPPPRRDALDLGWSDARDAAQVAGAQTALLAADDHRPVVLDALHVLGQSDPVADISGWTWQPGVPESAPQASALRDARNAVERIARKELGATVTR